MSNLTEITEDNVNDFIKEGKVIIDFWMERCPNCSTFSSTFENVSRKFNDIKFGKLFFDRDSKDASEFKRRYLKADKGEKIVFPVTFLFEDGVIKRKNYGLLDETQLEQFVSGEQVKDNSEQVKKKLLYDLFAQRGELTYNLEILQNKLVQLNLKINETINKR